MHHLTDLSQPGQHADTLVISPPSPYRQPEDFIKEGIVQALRQRQLAIDLMMAQALPTARIDKMWPVWQQLWHNFPDKRFATNIHD